MCGTPRDVLENLTAAVVSLHADLVEAGCQISPKSGIVSYPGTMAQRLARLLKHALGAGPAEGGQQIYASGRPDGGFQFE
eukprot:14129401-Alexandrium_andersonii.AAC.1